MGRELGRSWVGLGVGMQHGPLPPTQPKKSYLLPSPKSPTCCKPKMSYLMPNGKTPTCCQMEILKQHIQEPALKHDFSGAAAALGVGGREG